MKSCLSLVLFSFISILAHGQGRPRSTQYIFNNYLLNPALSGIDNYIDVKMGFRNQWQGLEGAPETYYVSLNAPFGEDFIRSSVNTFPAEGENPMSRQYVNSFMSAEPHHGVGFHAITDKAGRIRQTSVNATYAYHLGLSEVLNLSVGVSGGFSSIGIDVDGVVGNMNDVLFAADYNNRIRPDVGLGIWLYTPRFFLGASGKQLVGKHWKTVDGQRTVEQYQQPSFYGTVGYKFFVGEDLAVIPSGLLSYALNSPAAIDANLKLAYKDKLWMGSGFRNNDSYSLMAGFNVGYLINLSYSYDFTTSPLKHVNNGSHEIVLGLLLNNRYKVNCSQRQF